MQILRAPLRYALMWVSVILSYGEVCALFGSMHNIVIRLFIFVCLLKQLHVSYNTHMIRI